MLRRSRLRFAVGVLSLLAVPTARAIGQAPTHASPGYAVTGTVVDQQGNTLDGAEVAVIDHATVTRLVHSDERGRFHFDSLTRDTATIRVRRLGFRSRELGVTISGDRAASMFVALEAATATLAAVHVDEDAPEHGSDQLKEFYTRARTNRMGHYLDEDQMDSLHPEHTSDALRAVPGVVVRPSARIGNIVRIRGCAPMIWVDGMRAPNVELDDVTRGPDVAAIEVYSSQAGVPAQYTDRRATCGTILVWTKVR